ncbi:MAG: nuclear transport factor 2 family protein [Alphaproteobacteria bacterium]|jgi:hypothetical protein|nr:nuclear transport factor 2 family protein [Alphaproteobacteria bacterium]MDP6814797.1 nuclear transport factor 2 family protein [Alphaproteobacteria bacterium]
MADREAVLFANEAFYRAFADRDAAAMEDIWADRDELTCIHPGWGALYGREAVIESWQAILGNPQAPAIRCLAATARMHGETAHVICFEEIDGNYLIATNLFIRQGRRWYLVHHQSGPTSEAPPPDADAEGTGPIN